MIVHGGCLSKALDAAEQLAQAGIDCEVIDLRVLRPLDDATILASVRKTHHVVVVDEPVHRQSAAEISARIVEQAFYELDAPIARVCTMGFDPLRQTTRAGGLPQPTRSSPRCADCSGERIDEFA